MPLPAALTSLTQAAADPTAMMKTYLQGQPAFQVNRERAATVLDAGFRTSDAYAKAKPFLFVGGLIGMVVSAVALAKRRQRGAETVTLWSAAFVASAATAWVTRPVGVVKAPPGSSAQTQGTFGALAVIDARRAKLKAQDPNFADKVFARFDSLPVIKSQIEQTPLLKAVL